MEKDKINKCCDKIEEILEQCLDSYFEKYDLEDVRDVLRELKGESKPPKFDLTAREIELIDLIDEDDVLSDCYIDYSSGRTFICTDHNVALLEEVLAKDINNLISKLKRIL